MSMAGQYFDNNGEEETKEERKGCHWGRGRWHRGDKDTWGFCPERQKWGEKRAIILNKP
jgi:hypothetical protein